MTDAEFLDNLWNRQPVLGKVIVTAAEYRRLFVLLNGRDTLDCGMWSADTRTIRSYVTLARELLIRRILQKLTA